MQISSSEIKLTSAGDGTCASSYEFPGAGSYDVTLRVTDPGGNTATDIATITVIANVTATVAAGAHAT